MCLVLLLSVVCGVQTGAACFGASLSRNFILYNYTSCLTWPPIRAEYPGLDRTTGLAQDFYQPLNQPSGPIIAIEPWSGHYALEPSLWMTAHWSAVGVGWQMLVTDTDTSGSSSSTSSSGGDSAGGSGSQLLPHGGSVVGMVPPAAAASNDLTLIVETLNTRDNTGGECPAHGGDGGGYKLTLQITGLRSGRGETVTVSAAAGGRMLEQEPPRRLQVWRTTSDSFFTRQPDVTLTEATAATPGVYTLELDVEDDAIYTVTTRTDLRKGVHPEPPAASAFPLPYDDDFDHSVPGSLPRYFADQAGSLEITPSGQAAQVVWANPGPLSWQRNFDPFTTIGDASWANVTASVEVLFPFPPAAAAAAAAAIDDDTDDTSTVDVGGGAAGPGSSDEARRRRRRRRLQLQLQDPPDENVTSVPYATICTRSDGPKDGNDAVAAQWPYWRGYCATLTEKGELSLSAGSNRQNLPHQPPLVAPRQLEGFDRTRPVRLSMYSHGSTHRAEATQQQVGGGRNTAGEGIGGGGGGATVVVVVATNSSRFARGLIGVGSGYHPISFDSFRVERTQESANGR